MPTFSWTQYSFNTPNTQLTREAWSSLRATTSKEHDEIIEQMKVERWAMFWKDQTFYKWSLGIFVFGIVCFAASEERSGLRAFGSLAVFFTFIACISLLVTVSSHASAVNRQCSYFRGEFGKAASSDSYEEYIKRANPSQ